MEFRNPTSFAQFLSANNLAQLDNTFTQLINCINNFNAACNCYKREDKQKMYDTCNKLYYNGILHIVPRFKNEFLSKTTDRQMMFYTEQGQFISILSR